MKCTGGWQYVVLVPGCVTSKKLHIRHEKNLRHASIVERICRKLCGPGMILSRRCIKSAMQRLEQGDVVTETQLARLKHGSVQWGKINAFRHKAIGHSGACSSTWRASDSVSNSARHRPLSQSGATGRILTARKARINLAKTFSCDNLAIIAEFNFSNVSIDLFGVLRGSSGSLKSPVSEYLHQGAPPDTTSLAIHRH